MRIRSIRPEFWSSEDIAALSWDARLVFIGLWNYVDDNGVGRDVDKLIVAALFPLEEDIQDASRRVHGALTELSGRDLITRYRVENKPYLSIGSFLTHQKINRPSEGRYPLPTSADTDPPSPLMDPSVSTPSTSPLGEGEKGRRGEGEKGEVTPPSPPLPGTDRPNLSVVPQPEPRRKPAHPLPSDFDLTDDMRAWVKEHQLVMADVLRQTTRFKEWCLSKDQRYVDWVAAWRNWINKAVDRKEVRKRGGDDGPPQHEWEMKRR